MKIALGIAFLILAMMALAACSGDSQAEEPIEISGPALVMFFTDS